MAFKVEFTEQADADLAGIIDHIGQDSPQAARQTYANIIQRCQALGETPDMAQQTYPGVRRLVVGAYLVFYRRRNRSGSELIEILRILHGARLIPPSLGG